MRIYTITDSNGQESQVQADDVEIQSMSNNGTSILYRFFDLKEDGLKVTIAFYPGDDQTKITSIPAQ